MLGSTLLSLQAGSNPPHVPATTSYDQLQNVPEHFTPAPHSHDETDRAVARLNEHLAALDSRLNALYAKHRSLTTQTSLVKQISQDTVAQRRELKNLQAQIASVQAQHRATKRVLADATAWQQITDKPRGLDQLTDVLPGGVPGQVLTRTATGYTWQDIQTYVYVTGGATPTPPPTFENPILWGDTEDDVLLWGDTDDDYIQWGD